MFKKEDRLEASSGDNTKEPGDTLEHNETVNMSPAVHGYP